MSTSWVDGAEGSGYDVDHLPYGVLELEGQSPRVFSRVGGCALDLAPVLDDAAFALPSLDAFLARGPRAWAATRERLQDLLTDPTHAATVGPHLHPLEGARAHLAWTVGDFADFYSSRDHAENVGRIFRPDAEPLPRNWLSLPIAYHSRAGSVVVSGTPVRRPAGQRRPGDDEPPPYGPSQRLDLEAEVGFVVGVASRLGEPVPVDAALRYLFGAVLLNDWSARDLQAWESQPLGPFLAKSFATSVSAWVTPMAALEPHRVPAPEQLPPPLPYLRESDRRVPDLHLEVEVAGHLVSRPRFAGMHWTTAQQVAHLTSNGAPLRIGDVVASGTVSGPVREERGCLLELTWNGREPLELADGRELRFLDDGDEVVLRARAGTVELGECRGRVVG